MRVVAYIFSFLAFLGMSMGLLYKVQNWPGAKSMLINGYLLSLLAGGFIFFHKLSEKKKNKKLEGNEKHPANSNNNILDA